MSLLILQRERKLPDVNEQVITTIQWKQVFEILVLDVQKKVLFDKSF